MMEHTHLHFKKLLDELSILFPHRNLVLKRWEEEERTNPTCVWVQAHVHTQKSNPLKVPESFTYLTLLNAPLSSSSFLKRPRQTQPARQLFKPLFTMFTGENKKLAQAELAVHSLHRQPRREALLHVSKTSQFPTVPREGLVDLGSWCPCLLSINHHLQAAVLKNFWFPAHTLPHHAHAFTRLLTNTLIPVFKSGQLKAESVLQSWSQLCVHCEAQASWHSWVQLGFCTQSVVCFCSGDIAWNKRAASCIVLMWKPNIQ